MAETNSTTSRDIPTLPIDAVARCTREAQRDGIFAGLSSGLVGAIIGSKFYRLNRNATILCGIVTGALAGYQFTQVFLATNLARLRTEQELLAKPKSGSEFTSTKESF